MNTNNKPTQMTLIEPIIFNKWQEYLYKITLGNHDKLSPVAEANMMQAFFVGFSVASGIMDALQDYPEKEYVCDSIKKELANFSQAQRDIAKKLGLPICNTGKTLADTYPEMFNG